MLICNINTVREYPFTSFEREFTFDNFNTIFYIASVCKLQVVLNRYTFDVLFCTIDWNSVLDLSFITFINPTSLC